MNAFGFFAKHPVPGKVKTRLGTTIGNEFSARLYAAFLADTADRFRTEFDQRWIGWSPGADVESEAEMNSARQFFETTSNGDFQLWRQPDVSLGERMLQFFQHAFRNGAHSMVLIGTDSPSLPRCYVHQAFDLLADNDVVIGPATDGGYYLIGQSKTAHDVFDGIEWSSASVLKNTIEKLRGQNLKFGLLDPWYDVDTADDLQMLIGHLHALHATGQEIPERVYDLLCKANLFQNVEYPR